MPNFTIRRRRRPTQPPPAPTKPEPPKPEPAEEKVEEMEVSESSESEEKMIDQAFSQLRVEKPQHRPQIVRNVENRPQPVPQYQPQPRIPATPVREEPKINPYSKLFGAPPAQ